ncbi:hypothetical protein [Alteromonas sp. KUL49]|uniref:hypothetical protein n=1 Tax=Alteromonas sp. KUL49 TaxID=2480798 RepID=UPI00102F244C|nr:hypothetical protein [Alteromonas sp. KUL49]TAP35010.1 hypothetical protein EYS00_18860 [Alteromonas sp. KUL49]
MSTLLVVSCGGCSSLPKETTADLPLIHSSLSFSLSAEETALSPSVQVDGNSIFIGGTRHNITSRYTSITGKNCVRFSTPNTSLKVACQSNGQWNYLKALVQEDHK